MKSRKCLGYTLVSVDWASIAVYSGARYIKSVSATDDERDALDTLELVFARVCREIRNEAAREKTAALKSLGLKRVKGAPGGVYWE